MGVGWSSIPQRTSAGACGCTQYEIDNGRCFSEVCPEDQERNSQGYLAWWAMKSHDVQDPSTWPNVGYNGTCDPAECPRWIDDDEPREENRPDTWRQYAINKYLPFTSMSENSRRHLMWQWKDHDHGSLSDKMVKARTAWQDPAAGTYEYYDADRPEEWTVDFSERTKLSTGGGCAKIPWIIQTETGRIADLMMMVVKPEGYTDPIPFRDTWVMAGDFITQDAYLITHDSVTMQPKDMRPVSYSGPMDVRSALSGAVTAAGTVDTSIFGSDMGLAPVVFSFQHDGMGAAPGSALSTFTIGFPTSQDAVWIDSEYLYGEAGIPPSLENVSMVYSERQRKLVVVGDSIATNGLLDRNQLWTFDIAGGGWKREGRLWVPDDMIGYTMTMDPIRDRAVIVGGRLVTANIPKTYILQMNTLRLFEIETQQSPQGPGGLRDHGAYLDPVEQALYVYGGRINGMASTGAFRLNLTTRQWTALEDGITGPAERTRPFVRHDRFTKTLWVGPGEEQVFEEGLVFWGVKEDLWAPQQTFVERDLTDWAVSGTFDPTRRESFPIIVSDVETYPGKLLMVKLETADPAVVLEVRDLSGNLIAQDLGSSTEKNVVFYGRNAYTATLAAGAGFDPAARPAYTLSVREAELQEAGSYEAAGKTNGVTIIGTTAFLSTKKGIEAVDITNPSTPQTVSTLNWFGSASPERIGRIKTPGLVTSVLVSENRLFAALVPFGRILMCVVSTAAALLLSPWGCGCGSESPGEIEDASVEASLDAKTDAGPQPEREWLPWPDGGKEDAFVWVPPDACLEPEDNPNVIVLPPDGTRNLGGFTNWSTFVTYSEEWGNYEQEVFYYDILSQTNVRVTERTASQRGPYGFGNEIIFHDYQFSDTQNDIYRIELFHYNIETGDETQLTDDPYINRQPKLNSDYLLFLSSEGCSSYTKAKLVLKSRHTDETTVLADCDQSPRTHSISEHLAAWAARPYPGHNRDIFVRDLAGETTIHLESTGFGEQSLPHTDEDHVVWVDRRDGRREIYMYTFSTGIEECLTPDPWEQAYSYMRNGIVSWCDYSFSKEWGDLGRCDVYVYDIKTGIGRRVTNCSEKWDPSFVDNGWILYGKWLGPQKYKLYVHDLVAEGILDTKGRVIP